MIIKPNSQSNEKEFLEDLKGLILLLNDLKYILDLPYPEIAYLEVNDYMGNKIKRAFTYDEKEPLWFFDSHCKECTQQITKLFFIEEEGPFCEECYEMTTAAIAATEENYRL